MPKWFQRQMLRAYLKKDIKQIKILNQCWFFYYKRHIDAS